jgi:putative ABC transport system permease protein
LPGDGHYVVILNQRAVELLWPGEHVEDVIGRSAYGGFTARGVAEVIGVVPTGRHVSIGEEPTAAVYTSLEQMRVVPTATLFFRTAGPPELYMQEVAARLRQLDAAVPIHDIESATALVDRALWGVRAGAGLLGIIASVGLLLAALGVYGVISNMVGERSREVGIRLALGARNVRVYRLVIGRVVLVVGAGILLGLVVVALAGRVAAGFLYGVPPTDLLTLGTVAACLFGTALLAAFIPARRATRFDPMEVLRSD